MKQTGCGWNHRSSRAVWISKHEWRGMSAMGSRRGVSTPARFQSWVWNATNPHLFCVTVTICRDSERVHRVARSPLSTTSHLYPLYSSAGLQHFTCHLQRQATLLLQPPSHSSANFLPNGPDARVSQRLQYAQISTKRRVRTGSEWG